MLHYSKSLDSTGLLLGIECFNQLYKKIGSLYENKQKLMYTETIELLSTEKVIGVKYKIDSDNKNQIYYLQFVVSKALAKEAKEGPQFYKTEKMLELDSQYNSDFCCFRDSSGNRVQIKPYTLNWADLN